MYSRSLQCKPIVAELDLDAKGSQLTPSQWWIKRLSEHVPRAHL